MTRTAVNFHLKVSKRRLPPPALLLLECLEHPGKDSTRGEEVLWGCVKYPCCDNLKVEACVSHLLFKYLIGEWSLSAPTSLFAGGEALHPPRRMMNIEELHTRFTHQQRRRICSLLPLSVLFFVIVFVGLPRLTYYTQQL